LQASASSSQGTAAPERRPTEIAPLDVSDEASLMTRQALIVDVGVHNWVKPNYRLLA